MLDRRSLLTGVTASVTMGILSAAADATVPLRLVLVHGRRQERLDPTELKSNWLNALRRAAQKLGRTDRKSTRLNSSHIAVSRMPSSA